MIAVENSTYKNAFIDDFGLYNSSRNLYEHYIEKKRPKYYFKWISNKCNYPLCTLPSNQRKFLEYFCNKVMTTQCKLHAIRERLQDGEEEWRGVFKCDMSKTGQVEIFLDQTQQGYHKIALATT